MMRMIGMGAKTRRIVMSGRFKTLALCAGVFVLALAVRLWTNSWLTDFWGDSYHHWLVTRLTMQNGGVYSDYKGLETVWSPLYHYVSIIALWISGRTDIEPLHWMNVLWGSLACALCALVAYNLFARRAAAVAAGAGLAVMTWHVAFSGMNVAEVFSGVMILALVYVAQTDRTRFGMLALFGLALAMPLTRTDLSVYLGIVVVWLWIQRRYREGVVILSGMVLALGGWSLWSYFKTGNFLHWYQQYAANNLHDWVLLNDAATSGAAALRFAEYMNRLSPFVLPALWAGVLSALTLPGPRGRGVWLPTALLAGHTLFLMVGYARGIVPLLTERYLALDLPLVAVLFGGGVVWLVEGWVEGWREGERERGRRRGLIGWVVAGVIVAIVVVRFGNDVPELEIRRWGIDREWQVGSFLSKEMQPGDIVLTDAPVAIYRSGMPVAQFVSSVEMYRYGAPSAAIRVKNVRWIVTQPVSYDAAESFVPEELMQAQKSGRANGLLFDLRWRYDPKMTDIQSEVWHVIEERAIP